ncbi:PilZ domain-containing protein [Halopseudomonas phragmitis]|uniref:PilZ domain-containing protein n=2 Tax=Pseudomonadaceae TaxID=135621 RepID=A0A1V0B613_9GAMM|nr:MULTISPECIES: PilZ domain-containing protein [Pseudomonadaceae]AQZ95359.1 hypothetical protein BVH74_11620 [Halopseudomonas phragmitis]RHW20118.1 PilZ domain-containing protein [Pseudomonas jilinensis]
MSFHDQHYSEKRDFIRMQIESEGQLTLTDSGESFHVHCQDLSSQGAQVILPRAVAEGVAVRFSLASPTPGLPGLEALGRVVRCSADEAQGFRVGIQFDSVG